MIVTNGRQACVVAALVAGAALLGLLSPAGAQQGTLRPDVCTTASQCHGLRPQMCKLCDNGRSACAHWACVKNQCVIETCPPKS